MFVLVSLLLAAPCGAPLIGGPVEVADADRVVRESYVKYEYRIPMRDGAKLYTVAWVPRDRSRTWPVLMMRTPYGVTHGVETTPELKTGRQVSRYFLSPAALKEGFIFVSQDVRGKLMSEGTFVDIRPKAQPGGVDEATDAYDTIDWLMKNLPAHNGRVGVWGVSYPGFYAAQAAIDGHPALKAVSPQAPVTDWFVGDDFHHNGALFLQDNFGFFQSFGKPRPVPTKKQSWSFDYETGDAYEFFLNVGPLSNVNSKYFKGEVGFWNDVMAHPTRDAWWLARDPLPRYKGSRAAVLVVGGLFDAEDLWGTVATYQAFEKQSPAADVRLVLGPWRHGGWSRSDGDALGDVSFGWKTSRHYQENIELPFFRKALKVCGDESPAEALVFETGTNLFVRHSQWPPAKTTATVRYLGPQGGFSSRASVDDKAYDSFLSDPAKPVPHRAGYTLENDGDYMVEDQRFAARRPDVLVYQTPVLTEDVTMQGPIDVNVWVSTTGSDLDVIVKVIDVYPVDAATGPGGLRHPGMQQLVRAEVMRGHFRHGFDKAVPFTPNKPEQIKFTLPDVSHTFRPGHRLMVHIQSTWFPLVARNPQTFVMPAQAKEEHYQAHTHTIWRDAKHPSALTFRLSRGLLP
jgi:uncharacterized protein